MMMLAFLLAAIMLFALLMNVLFFLVGARVVQAPKATFARALAATLILVVVSLGYLFLCFWLVWQSAEFGGILPVILIESALAFAQLFLTWYIIKAAFGTTFLRAVLIWSMPLIPSVVFSVVTILPLRLLVTEAFVVPTNSMAPSIIGWHREARCPHCQGKLVVPATDPGQQFQPPVDVDRPGICMSCRKVSEKPLADADLHGPERILVNKLLTPERWDIIVFRYPPEPAQKYVMRLVGLPGEKVYIKGDSVWINDKKFDVPTDLSGLEYATDMGFVVELRGTEENPVRLGADEFFVLGDFSKSSSDSRFWGPVPRANIEGVACLRYWPFERWLVFR